MLQITRSLMALRSLRPRSLFVRMIVGGALVALPATSQAQIDGAALGAMFMQSLIKGIEKTNNTRILISPSMVKVDAAQKTATITFENKTEDTLDAEVSVRLQAPLGDMFGGGASVKTKTGNASSSPLLDDEPADTKPDSSATVDSISADRSLAGWIKGLPASVTLKPREKKTVTITLDVPANLTPGDYAAWIITSTAAPLKFGAVGDDASGTTMEMKVDEENPAQVFKVEAGARVVYKVEAAK